MILYLLIFFLLFLPTQIYVLERLFINIIRFYYEANLPIFVNKPMEL